MAMQLTRPTEGLWRSFIEKHYPTLREATGGGGGGRFCDIGAADGSLTAYIAGNLGMNASAYDIMSPDENKYSQIAGSAEIGKTQTAIELFDGQHIPQPDSGCTITLFAYVLHHAAEKTFRLLTEALRVTPPHGYLMLAEDLAEPTNAERSANMTMQITFTARDASSTLRDQSQSHGQEALEGWPRWSRPRWPRPRWPRPSRSARRRNRQALDSCESRRGKNDHEAEATRKGSATS